MSTTFAVKIPSSDELVNMFFRSNDGTFTSLNPIHELLSDNTPLYPIDNESQAIKTIGDIKWKIFNVKSHNRKPLCW